MNGIRIPPLTARIGQACHKCFTEESADAPLSRCSNCRSVAYCGPACQKGDWTTHKAICKALHKVESDTASRSILLFIFSDDPISDSGQLKQISITSARNMISLVHAALKRPMNTIESNIVGFEPKCRACTRSDRVIRMEKSPRHSALQSCPDCRLSFYCSEEHWDSVSHQHKNTPAEDGYDGFSQCELNQAMRVDISFARLMESGSPGQRFQWAPERTLAQWKPMGDGWEADYGSELKRMVGGGSRGPPITPFLRGSSEGLSFPATILYALQNLNEGKEWTNKDTLVIHVLGASVTEVAFAQMFEELLHRLPKVKTLRLVLCGPDLNELNGSGAKELDMQTCPECVRYGRKRIQELHANKYHEYAQKLGNEFVKPDLAIAFNSGASQVEVESWKDTLKFLVDQKITTTFTSYNREEAEGEARIFRNLGAELIPALGPKKNPWGSQLLRPEPNSVTGFYAVNGWLCCGFR